MKVAVLGAGGAGLAAARKLRRAGTEVTVFDAETRAGGKIHSHREAGFLCEEGPNSITAGSPTALRLARELNLPIVEARPPRTRYVIRRGKMRVAPSFGLLSPSGWARAALEPLLWKRRASSAGAGKESAPKDAPDESLRDFFVRHFGVEAGQLGATLMAAGVYAGDPTRLSAAHAFGRFTALEDGAGSLVLGGMRAAKQAKADRVAGEPSAPTALWSLGAGLGSLAEAMAAGLGDSLQLRTRVEQIEPLAAGYRVRLSGAGAGDLTVDGLIGALPPRPAAHVLGPLAPPLAHLSEIRSSAIVVVHLGFRAEDLARPPAGFGVLNGDGTGEVMGVLFPSSLFAGRAPEGAALFTALLGGIRHPKAGELSDEALVDTCLGTLRPFFGPKKDPIFRRVVRWHDAVPQPELGHGKRIAAATAALRSLPPCELAGAAIAGASVEQVLTGGEAAADRLLARLNVAPSASPQAALKEG